MAVLTFAYGAAVGWAFTYLLNRTPRTPAGSVNDDGHWEFPMDTLGQMLAIPAERRERFISELPAMFRRMWDVMDAYPVSAAPGAKWVDDGAGEFRPNIVNAPADMTGELSAVRPLKGDV